jgi:hypothetical protein
VTADKPRYSLTRDDRCPSLIQGQLLRLSERREVAIYVREGSLWIADFIDGRGELVEPVAWFRFNCGTPSTRPARRRMLLESAIPLSVELAAKIEGLHRPAPDAARGDDRKEE